MKVVLLGQGSILTDKGLITASIVVLLCILSIIFWVVHHSLKVEKICDLLVSDYRLGTEAKILRVSFNALDVNRVPRLKTVQRLMDEAESTKSFGKAIVYLLRYQENIHGNRMILNNELFAFVCDSASRCAINSPKLPKEVVFL